MKKLIVGIAVLAAAFIPAAGFSEEVCTDAATSTHDCVRVTGNSTNNGGTIEVDGDDSDPRGDSYTDGYVALSGDTSGGAVYCEDEGGFNYGDSDEQNGTNQECQDAAP